MNTYTDLANAVTAYAAQSGNPEFTSMVKTFILMGEANIYRNLRHDRMIKNMGLDGAGPYLLPDDFLEMSAVNHGYTVCEYLPSEILLNVDVSTGAPTAWSLFGNEIVFNGTVTEETVISYFAKPPGIDYTPTPDSWTEGNVQAWSAESTVLWQGTEAVDAPETNALFLLNPDLYLYAALAQAMVFLRDEARQAVWDGLFQQKLQELKDASWHARIPKQQPLIVRSYYGR